MNMIKKGCLTNVVKLMAPGSVVMVLKRGSNYVKKGYLSLKHTDVDAKDINVMQVDV